MKAQATAAAKEAPQSAAVRSDTGGSGFVDARPEATAQRELAAEIRNGAYVTAQRQRLRGMFGDAAQRRIVPCGIIAFADALGRRLGL